MSTPATIVTATPGKDRVVVMTHNGVHGIEQPIRQLLTAAVLVFDPANPAVAAAMNGAGTIDVKTAQGGTYDPDASNDAGSGFAAHGSVRTVHGRGRRRIRGQGGDPQGTGPPQGLAAGHADLVAVRSGGHAARPDALSARLRRERDVGR